jgi:hypothetical protein
MSSYRAVTCSALEMTLPSAEVSTLAFHRLQNEAAMITFELPNMTDSLIPAIMASAVASNTTTADCKALISRMKELPDVKGSTGSILSAADHAIQHCTLADEMLQAVANRLNCLASECATRTQLPHP